MLYLTIRKERKYDPYEWVRQVKDSSTPCSSSRRRGSSERQVCPVSRRLCSVLEVPGVAVGSWLAPGISPPQDFNPTMSSSRPKGAREICPVMELTHTHLHEQAPKPLSYLPSFYCKWKKKLIFLAPGVELRTLCSRHCAHQATSPAHCCFFWISLFLLCFLLIQTGFVCFFFCTQD